MLTHPEEQLAAAASVLLFERRNFCSTSHFRTSSHSTRITLRRELKLLLYESFSTSNLLASKTRTSTHVCLALFQMTQRAKSACLLPARSKDRRPAHTYASSCPSRSKVRLPAYSRAANCTSRGKAGLSADTQAASFISRPSRTSPLGD